MNLTENNQDKIIKRIHDIFSFNRHHICKDTPGILFITVHDMTYGQRDALCEIPHKSIEIMGDGTIQEITMSLEEK